MAQRQAPRAAAPASRGRACAAAALCALLSVLPGAFAPAPPNLNVKTPCLLDQHLGRHFGPAPLTRAIPRPAPTVEALVTLRGYCLAGSGAAGAPVTGRRRPPRPGPPLAELLAPRSSPPPPFARDVIYPRVRTQIAALPNQLKPTRPSFTCPADPAPGGRHVTPLAEVGRAPHFPPPRPHLPGRPCSGRRRPW